MILFMYNVYDMCYLVCVCCDVTSSLPCPISLSVSSAVYLVRHKETRKRFAMKKVSKHRMLMKKQV